MHVGQGLGFHALGGIHDEHGAIASGEGAAHLVGEVHVAGGIQQVELVGIAILGLVAHGHGVGLDGNPLLALQVHGVQELVLLVALADGIGKFQETVRQSGLTVVNVGNDGEIAFESDVRCHARARIRDKRP